MPVAQCIVTKNLCLLFVDYCNLDEEGDAVNSQFIVSAHSPFIVQSLDADELFDIKIMQYAEEGNYRGRSIEAIQEHKMGIKTVDS